MPKDIIIACAEEGDWYGIYWDNKLRHEGHSLDIYDILKKLGHEVSYIEVPADYSEQHGSFPVDIRYLIG